MKKKIFVQNSSFICCVRKNIANAKGKTKRVDAKHVRQNRLDGKSKTNQRKDDVNIISCTVFRRSTGTRARKEIKIKMDYVLLS